MNPLPRLRKQLSRLSLTARLTMWYVGLLAVLALALGTFVLVGLGRLSTAALIAEGTRQNQEVQQGLAPLLATGQPLGSGAQAVLDTQHGPPGQLIAVAGPDGRVVAHTPGPSDLVEVVRPTGIDALRGGASEWIAVLDSTDGQMVVRVIPLVDPVSGGLRGYVQVTTPTASAALATQIVGTLFTLGLGIALLVAVVVGPRVTRLGLRPLRGMARASRRLAEGDLTTRVQEPDTVDEVGDLARAFNEMAERLEAAFAAQHAFVADASHELRSPLHALGGQIDVQLRVLDDRPEEARRLAGFMRREVDRLTVLVEDLLVLARLEAQGAEALQVGVFDLVSVARDVYEQTLALPVSSGRSVQLELDAGRVPVTGDAYRLHQVMLNLTTNGLQHAPTEQGCVTLTVRRQGTQALIQVRDNGAGLPPEHVAHVFDRFYRTDSSRARLTGGAGLGLAIARAIVEAHRGMIVAANSAGGGALFSVMLPLAS
ncbi:MAG: HAMP domain-containing histidine kinase [Chloroflexota bacterium]|nr:HAMP domain-containing histidine kinase [Chloroflexota bacterium]